MLFYLLCSLALYIFYSNLYLDEQKSYPKYDLIIAAVLAFVWLCAASAWAHAVLGLRSIADVEVSGFHGCIFVQDRIGQIILRVDVFLMSIL